jgi:hypothetical protein
MAMTSNTADTPAFAAPSSRLGKTSAMMIEYFLEINTLQGTVLVREIVDFTRTPQVIDGVVFGI